MTKHESLPVAGYTSQGDDAVKAVNGMKQIEAGLLVHLELLAANSDLAPDKRWLAIGRTKLELGFMAVNRAIFKPQPVKPEQQTPPRGAWMIEDGSSNAARPRYLLSIRNTWGYEIDEALQFSREQDANNVASQLNAQVPSRVAFHEWDD